jgi:DNA repair ATPase RecN
MDQDPIRQVQSFSEERYKMLEQIRSISSTLVSFRADPPSMPALNSATNSSADATLMDLQYQRLMQALREMQTQIDHRVRPAVQLMVQNEVDHLRAQSEEKLAALRNCLSQIDQSILQCLAGLDEYQKCYVDLVMLNKKLTDLGVSPEPLPENISLGPLSETISARITNLGRY